MATKKEKNPVIIINDKEVELVLTRDAIRRCEDKGIFNIQLSRSQPTNFLYGLAYTAAFSWVNTTVKDFAKALDDYFEKGGSFNYLMDALMDQYKQLFNISAEDGENME